LSKWGPFLLDSFVKISCICNSVYPREIDINNEATVPWCQLEKVSVGRSNDGKGQHVLHLEHKETPPHVLITILKPKQVEFVIHNFEAIWQDKVFKMCLKNLTIDQILSIVD
jgi:hypothetical protein